VGIARKPNLQAGHGIPGVDNNGHQVRPTTIEITARNPGRPTEAIPTRTKPALAPPTPPPTPPADYEPVRINHDHQDDVAKGAPRRIIAHPLPPTPTPMVLGHKTTLFIPDQCAPSPYECVLRIGSRRISVIRGGDAVEVSSGNKVLRICRGEYKDWSHVERKQWETVWGLMEQVKRTTARVSDCLFYGVDLMGRSRYIIPLP
jgi:hypothetical protein